MEISNRLYIATCLRSLINIHAIYINADLTGEMIILVSLFG